MLRLAIAGVGLAVILVGLGAWSLETEYGGNAVGGSELGSDGVTRVFDIDEQTVDDEGHQVTTIVFEGTESEAEAFMHARWQEGRNYLVPGSIIGLGAVVLLWALAGPLPKRSRDRTRPVSKG